VVARIVGSTDAGEEPSRPACAGIVGGAGGVADGRMLLTGAGVGSLATGGIVGAGCAVTDGGREGINGSAAGRRRGTIDFAVPA